MATVGLCVSHELGFIATWLHVPISKEIMKVECAIIKHWKPHKLKIKEIFFVIAQIERKSRTLFDYYSIKFIASSLLIRDGWVIILSSIKT
jgi:hypothetical protein